MHAQRRSAARAALGALHDEALVVTTPANVRYLSGFSGSNGALLLHASDPGQDKLGTDSRYTLQAAREAPDLEVVIDRDTLPALVLAAAEAGIRRLRVEGSLGIACVGRLRGMASIEEVLPAESSVELNRVVKDPGEMALIAQACAITAQAMSQLLQEARAGQTEIQLARRLEQLFGELGAEERAFATIVGAGPHSAIPHHQPTARPLARGDLLVIDAGARVGGYHADMTRTAIVAAEAEPWQSEIHEAVLHAQRAGIDAIGPGVEVRAVDAAAREVIGSAGYAEFFSHGLGHGVGLEIHEAPMLGPRSEDRLALGSVVTIEPGIYLPGRGGVRIEDSLAIGSDGPRILTEASRALLVVG